MKQFNLLDEVPQESFLLSRVRCLIDYKLYEQS